MASLAAAVAVVAVVAGEMMFSQISIAAMAILLGWGITNLSLGLSHWRIHEESRRYFWQMNFIWGAINTLLAGLALINLSPPAVLDSISQYQQIIVIGWNIGLDLVYLMIGFCLLYYRRDKRTSRRLGYGRATVLQGSFLLIFDGILWLTLLKINML